MKADESWRNASDSFIVVLDGRPAFWDAMSSVSCSPIRAFSLVDLVSHDLALHTKVLAMALVVTSICRFCRYVYVSMYGYGQDAR